MSHRVYQILVKSGKLDGNAGRLRFLLGVLGEFSGFHLEQKAKSFFKGLYVVVHGCGLSSAMLEPSMGCSIQGLN